jgi:hypothetical protein
MGSAFSRFRPPTLPTKFKPKPNILPLLSESIIIRYVRFYQFEGLPQGPELVLHVAPMTVTPETVIPEPLMHLLQELFSHLEHRLEVTLSYHSDYEATELTHSVSCIFEPCNNLPAKLEQLSNSLAQLNHSSESLFKLYRRSTVPVLPEIVVSSLRGHYKSSDTNCFRLTLTFCLSYNITKETHLGAAYFLMRHIVTLFQDVNKITDLTFKIFRAGETRPAHIYLCSVGPGISVVGQPPVSVLLTPL